jgi:predicted nicotinamide N-methyase
LAFYGFEDTPLSFSQLQQQLRRTLPDAGIESYDLPDCIAPSGQPLRLGLINANFSTGPLAAETMRAVIREPAYWAFCWGSGLALAQFLLANPEWVQDRKVVDLGSGSGVAGIAAALAGAASVVACDTDPDARLATRVNAAHNGVDLETTARLPDRCDMVLMADVLYDRQNLPLLNLAQAHASEVLVADSRVTQLPDPGYQEVTRIEALTCPNLGEFDEFRVAHIFSFRS